jgi:hypothetical protein
MEANQKFLKIAPFPEVFFSIVGVGSGIQRYQCRLLPYLRHMLYMPPPHNEREDGGEKVRVSGEGMHPELVSRLGLPCALLGLCV